jgi:hypothetical protein
MNCEYCGRSADKIEGVQAAVCTACWALLQNPVTALPLIRGHLTLTLRGQIPDEELKKRIDAFMAMIASWKRPG